MLRPCKPHHNRPFQAKSICSRLNTENRRYLGIVKDRLLVGENYKIEGLPPGVSSAGL